MSSELKTKMSASLKQEREKVRFQILTHDFQLIDNHPFIMIFWRVSVSGFWMMRQTVALQDSVYRHEWIRILFTQAACKFLRILMNYGSVALCLWVGLIERLRHFELWVVVKRSPIRVRRIITHPDRYTNFKTDLQRFRNQSDQIVFDQKVRSLNTVAHETKREKIAVRPDWNTKLQTAQHDIVPIIPCILGANRGWTSPCVRNSVGIKRHGLQTQTKKGQLSWISIIFVKKKTTYRNFILWSRSQSDTDCRSNEDIRSQSWSQERARQDEESICSDWHQSNPKIRCFSTWRKKGSYHLKETELTKNLQKYEGRVVPWRDYIKSECGKKKKRTRKARLFNSDKIHEHDFDIFDMTWKLIDNHPFITVFWWVWPWMDYDVWVRVDSERCDRLLLFRIQWTDSVYRHKWIRIPFTQAAFQSLVDSCEDVNRFDWATTAVLISG